MLCPFFLVPMIDSLRAMIHFRASTPVDGQRVLEIWRRAVDATHDFLSSQDRHDIELEVVAFLPEAPLWLAADEDDRAIGFMLLSDSHMEALFIDPAHRGSGVGRALVQYALELHPGLTTDVNEQNVVANGFYTHLGFERIGRSAVDAQGRPYPLIHLRHSAKK
jgi:putative acetyltransferase